MAQASVGRAYLWRANSVNGLAGGRLGCSPSAQASCFPHSYSYTCCCCRPGKDAELLDAVMATLRGDGNVLLPIDTGTGGRGGQGGGWVGRLRGGGEGVQGVVMPPTACP